MFPAYSTINAIHRAIERKQFFCQLNWKATCLPLIIVSLERAHFQAGPAVLYAWSGLFPASSGTTCKRDKSISKTEIHIGCQMNLKTAFPHIFKHRPLEETQIPRTETGGFLPEQACSCEEQALKCVICGLCLQYSLQVYVLLYQLLDSTDPLGIILGQKRSHIVYLLGGHKGIKGHQHERDI
jgi:hypothetical protein